jgi:hypothetical protein
MAEGAHNESHDAGLVYVIGSPGSQTVKIGLSRNPAKRLWFLQVGSPDELRLLATFKGGQKLEAALHRYFAAFHRRGEWYELGADPIEAVRAAVNLGVSGLLSANPKYGPRAARSQSLNVALQASTRRALDWDVRFPPLQAPRAQAILAAIGVSAPAPEGVQDQQEPSTSPPSRDLSVLKRLPKWRQIADEITSQIHRGIYAPGDRLPSVQDQVMEGKGATATVHRAYQALEAEGLVRTAQGSGTTVLGRRRPIPPEGR